MASITIEQAAKEHNAALATSEQLQDRWLRGQCTFDELASARQYAAHLGGRLDAMREREAARKEAAEAEAMRKQAHEKAVRKAKASLEKAKKELLASENFKSAALEILRVSNESNTDPVANALGLVIDTLDPEIKAGPSRGLLDRVRFTEGLRSASGSVLPHLEVEALRKDVAQQKEILASSNGHNSKKERTTA